ncbi:MAG: 3-deoxy-manno-octulosonate cytidylyltransferase, partial [Pseudomonadota bacterium]
MVPSTAFRVVIPARFAATRLPGKPLLRIAGRPLIQHVFDRARQSGAREIVIATDDPRIAECASGFGAQVCMTAANHPNGSSRIAEVCDRLGWADDAVLVNLQGDEPCIPPGLIDQVATDLIAHPNSDIATLACPIQDRETIFDPGVVKVVRDLQGFALYFSRAPIPWHREGFGDSRGDVPEGLYWRHIGLYAYRAVFLRRYVHWPATPLEQAESLEQLRALERGSRIRVSLTGAPTGPGVDTPADVARVEAWLNGHQRKVAQGRGDATTVGA